MQVVAWLLSVIVRMWMIVYHELYPEIDFPFVYVYHWCISVGVLRILEIVLCSFTPSNYLLCLLEVGACNYRFVVCFVVWSISNTYSHYLFFTSYVIYITTMYVTLRDYSKHILVCVYGPTYLQFIFSNSTSTVNYFNRVCSRMTHWWRPLHAVPTFDLIYPVCRSVNIDYTIWCPT